MNSVKTIIVDDEKRLRNGIARIVQNCGAEWEIAGTFQDGLAALEYVKESEHAIDLLITDVKMPEMDGLTLIKEIKRWYRQRPFHSIIVSGYEDFQYLKEAIREGAFDYVLKPIDREQFAELLDRAKHKIRERKAMETQWNELTMRAEKYSYLKQKQLLSEAVLSEYEDVAALTWIKDSFPRGWYQLLFISTDEFPLKTREYTPKDWGIMSYALQNITEEVSAGYGRRKEGNQSWWWSDGGFHYWVLLYSPCEEAQTVQTDGEDFANELKSSISRYSPFTVSVALSDPFEDLAMIHATSHQLSDLMRFRMIYGGNRVFTSQLPQMKPPIGQQSLSAEIKETVHKITTSLGRATIPELEKAIQLLFKEMAKFQSPADIILTIQYLNFQIYGAILDSFYTGEFLREWDDLTQEIKIKSSFNTVKESVKRLVLLVHETLVRYGKESHQDPVLRAKTWIKQNLDQKISIKSIAEQVNLNPTYFCEYFKKQTGMTLLDYVTEVRMEKAKELLQSTDLKIGEISESLGYQDTKYFSRLFKQRWGKLPSEYKKA